MDDTPEPPKNEIAIRQQEPDITTSLTPRNMDEAVRLATIMSRAKLVPTHLQNDPGSCLMVVEQAMRWRMSPFFVAQCTSVISGKLNYEGKLIAAAIESSGAIHGHLDYTFTGSGDDRTVTVSAQRRGESDFKTIDIRLGDVKTTNEFWRKQPDMQLTYSGTRNWARRWTPAVMLGVYSPEEWGRDVDRTVRQYPSHTIDGTVATDDAEIAAQAEPVVTAPPPPPARRLRDVLDAIEKAAEAALTEDDLDALERDDDVRKVRAEAPPAPKARMEERLAFHRARIQASWQAEQPQDEGDPEWKEAEFPDELPPIDPTRSDEDWVAYQARALKAMRFMTKDEARHAFNVWRSDAAVTAYLLRLKATRALLHTELNQVANATREAIESAERGAQP